MRTDIRATPRVDDEVDAILGELSILRRRIENLNVSIGGLNYTLRELGSQETNLLKRLARVRDQRLAGMDRLREMTPIREVIRSVVRQLEEGDR